MCKVEDLVQRFHTHLNTIHIDETWFHLMRDGKRVRIFPRDLMARAPKAQHKSHIPKVMFIVANSRQIPTTTLMESWKSGACPGPKLHKGGASGTKKGRLIVLIPL